MAREAGIEPLADKLFTTADRLPIAASVRAEASWAMTSRQCRRPDGVRDILSERQAETLPAQGFGWLWSEGPSSSKLVMARRNNADHVLGLVSTTTSPEPVPPR
jgi:uncharacterized protein